MWMLSVLVLISIVSTNTHYLLYDTHIDGLTDKYDCLITDERSNGIAHYEFCRRPMKPVIVARITDDCGDGHRLLFSDLRNRNWTISKMILERLPIDTIDDYYKYLENTDLENQFFCYCDAESFSTNFGTGCEYKFNDVLEETKYIEPFSLSLVLVNLDDAIHEVAYTRKNLTSEPCYIDLPECDAGPNGCIHWNQVCDGAIDCQNGIDELHCFSLELNQCNNKTEYRCRQGTCIPLVLAFDTIIDCADASDEYRYTSEQQVDEFNHICEERQFLFCHEHKCSSRAFACGDGICTHSVWSRSNCYTRRDVNFIRNILSVPNTEKNPCWIYAICELGFIAFIPDVTGALCLSVSCDKSMILFPARHPLFPPNVHFIYELNDDYDIDIVRPNFICFNIDVCKNATWPIVTRLNRTCVSLANFDPNDYLSHELDRFMFEVRQQFTGCYFPAPKNIDNAILFDCENSYFISKHRLYDGEGDCPAHIDEHADIDSCSVNLANRFQCRTDKTTCIPRLFLSDGVPDCKDGSDEMYLYSCLDTSSEIGCKWKRGSVQGQAQFWFFKLCDSFVDITIGNITDEDDCPTTWINQCVTDATRCDGYWHCKDGRDELNCSIAQFNLCNNTQQFYCVDRNTKNKLCYSTAIAGDSQEDCLGAVDERVSGFCQRRYPEHQERRFHCRNSSICLTPKQLCDGNRDCSDDSIEDEGDLCSWRRASTEANLRKGFVCTNKVRLDVSKVCNGKRDCPNGEDEQWCNIIDPPWSSAINKQLMTDIVVYPPTSIITPSLIKRTQQVEPTENRRLNHLKQFSNERLLYVITFCNRGLVSRRNYYKQDVCFCPSYLYGDRCEFQRRRVTITARLETSSFYMNELVPLRLIFYLMDATTFNILDTSQHTIVPHQLRINTEPSLANRLLIYLLFPIRQNASSNYSAQFVKIDAFTVSDRTVDFHASWYYNLPFPFLPVQRLAIHLLLVRGRDRSLGSCGHGVRMPYVNSDQSWCLCESGWTGKECRRPETVCHPNPCYPGSVCISVNEKYKCLCPINRFGRTCRIPTTHVCNADTCSNNGTCIVLNINAQFSVHRFFCACPNGFTGYTCEKESSNLRIRFHSKVIEKYRVVQAMVLRLCYIAFKFQSADSFRRVLENVELAKPLPIFQLERKWHPIDFGFLQIFTSSDDARGQYYLIISNNSVSALDAEKDRVLHINTTTIEENHCPHVDKLLPRSIYNLAPLQRAKFYQEPCQNNPKLVCFYDESFMCVCDRFRIVKCFHFTHDTTTCSNGDSCLNNGLCLQENGIQSATDFLCVCQPCYFGNLCQFTISQYSLSLDALIGPFIDAQKSILQQSFIVQLSFALMLILACLGLFFNTITTVLFLLREKCRTSGSGYYIITSAVFSSCALLVLVFKFTTLIFVPYLSSGLGCISIEYFLRFFPTSVDWINVCVLIEHTRSVRNGIRFNKNESKKIAKLLIPSVIFAVGVSFVHDPLHRESIVDLRLDHGRRPWCMVRLENKGLKLYNIMINLSHYLIPFVINSASAAIIVISLARTKSLAKHQAYNMVLKEQLIALKHLMITPIVLVIVVLPRLIFSVIFTCLERSASWQIHLLLAGYFISFLPLTANFFIYVLNSVHYKGELIRLLKKQRQ